MTGSLGPTQRTNAWGFSAWRTIASAALLAAASVCWAGLPLSGGAAGTRATLILAIGCGVLSVVQLAVERVKLSEPAATSLADRTWQYLVGIVQALPWAELTVIAVLVLEVLHRSQPWHTGVLGVALLGYLLAIHLYETRTGPGILGKQLPPIAAGIGLVALAAGAAELPGLPSGPDAAAIRLVATIGAVVVGGLAIPLSPRRRSRSGD